MPSLSCAASRKSVAGWSNSVLPDDVGATASRFVDPPSRDANSVARGTPTTTAIAAAAAETKVNRRINARLRASSDITSPEISRHSLSGIERRTSTMSS